MWRIFRWLDRHPPSFHKLTLMAAGLGAVVGGAFLLGFLHPAAGLLFGFGMCFVLMHASMTYRFVKKPKPPSERELPISQASDREVLRRVDRHAKAEFWRRQILAARHEKGKRGDLARSIIKRWEDAGMPDGRPAPRKDEGS